MPPRRGRRVSADENNDGGGSEIEEEVGAATTAQDVPRLAGQLVRLALFHEYKRQPLKRDVISKLVLGGKRGNFDEVFAQAQTTLKAVFGMELYELRAKYKGELAEAQAAEAAASQRKKGKGRARNGGDDDNEDEDDDEEEEQAEGDGEQRPRKRKAAGTKSYILRSTLDPVLVAAMADPRPLPMPSGAAAEDEDHIDALEKDSGALIRWEKADGTASGGIGMLGVRTVILCLILCLGRSAHDDQLHALLRRLEVSRDTLLPFVSEDGKEEPIVLDKYLDLLAKQHYLEKAKVPNPSAPDGHVIEWRWGSREAEFSEAAAAAFIERIFITRDDNDESEAEEEGPEDLIEEQPDGTRARISRAQFRKKKREKLRKDLVRAAGGELSGKL